MISWHGREILILYHSIFYVTLHFRFVNFLLYIELSSIVFNKSWVENYLIIPPFLLLFILMRLLYFLTLRGRMFPSNIIQCYMEKKHNTSYQIWIINIYYLQNNTQCEVNWTRSIKQKISFVLQLGCCSQLPKQNILSIFKLSFVAQEDPSVTLRPSRIILVCLCGRTQRKKF